MWDDGSDPLRRELDPNETLLWSGQPRKGLALRSSDLVQIPFGLLVCGYAFFWEEMAIRNSELIPKILGLPLVLVGIYMMIGRFVYDAYIRGKVFYGVTNERVIILSNVFGVKVQSLKINLIPAVILEEKKKDASGTIYFGPKTSDFTGFGRRNKREPETPSFVMIPDARNVYRIIRDAQQRIESSKTSATKADNSVGRWN